MAADPRNPVAAGAPLALAILVGTLVGAGFGQPTIGLLAGLAIGSAIAVAVWLHDRGRKNR